MTNYKRKNSGREAATTDVQLFGHEKLRVYQKALEFVALRKTLMEGLSQRVAASDHLIRAGESIPVNTAYASSSWSPKERIVYLGHASGSALECAACLDIFVAKGRLSSQDIYPAKGLLSESVSMLVRMRNKTADRIQEEPAPYYTKKGNLFSHEDLDVYQAELKLISWLENISPQFACSTDLLSKLDKSTTSIVLNTAEGNGRFSKTDQVKFLGLAYKATVHSSSLVDLGTATDNSTEPDSVEQGRKLLRRIAAMLKSLSKAVTNDN